AVVRDASNNILTVAPNWSVAAGGGSINGAGGFTAGNTSGTFPNTVVASVGNVSGAATVTVTTGALASVTVTPNPQTLAQGGTQQYTAVGRDANGNVVAFTPTWSIQAGGGTITSGGVFTAGNTSGTFANTVRACSTAACASGSSAGFATVSVNPGALASITVTPDPVNVGTNANQQFVAVGRDANGNIVGILPTWTVKPGDAGGSILNPSGVYTAPPAVGVGFDTVRATVGTITGAARANVTASGALVSISVTPNPANVVVNGTVQMTATGFDASGLVVPTPGLVWSVVVPPGGGTINPSTGLFTAGTVVGFYTNSIKATSGTVSGLATANVTPGPQPGPSLGTAETHGILAGSTFTCAAAPGIINADASVWPGTTNSGFPPCVITGQTNLGTPAAQQAQSDLTAAYLALAAMPCGTTITSDLGGTTLAEGVYCSGSSVGVTGTVTLTGNANSLFVIRAPSTLTTAGNVVMAGGALAKNVYWWVGSSATIGVGSQWQGNIIALSTISLNPNATLCGRALARNGAVTLAGNNIIKLPPATPPTCVFP
ncbi:MAG TPA: ice-binding family protein, partial [Vicinamibacterales bacterium]|nr:ice-binding family protein [Vicinamibacterales bacterium]